MAPVTLKGDTLGKKHQHFNKLVQDAVTNKNYVLRNISDADSDVGNLLKIHIASKTRNVDYIIEVMKSNDMLYAATAIKQSTWLITEQQYAHIINPEYLHTQVLPSMNTKTFNKLMLHIRLNLKDESRVETFYEFLKETDRSYKWLEHCSIPFIEKVMKNERLIPISLFKRLCRRSAHFLSYHKRVEVRGMYYFETELLFMVKSHPEEYLNFVEEQNHFYINFTIGRKRTEMVMKTCPHRVFDKFERYAGIIDLSVATKYFKQEQIKPVLIKEMKRNQCWKFDKLRHFVKNMPEQEKLHFINQTFIDKTNLIFFPSEHQNDEYRLDLEFYHWYKYVPFNVAYPELIKLILAEYSPSERCAMLSVLITCAIRDPQHTKTLLRFFYERHINEPLKFKTQFTNKLLLKISTHELDAETWNILDKLFHSMEVYTESENNVQRCLESIILYRVLHDEPVPEIVEQKMAFNTFNKFTRKLKQDQNDKMFTYLLNSVLKKVQIEKIANESDFSKTVAQLNNALTLIRDWKKNICKYSFIFEKIQQLIKIRQEHKWETDMSCLYNVKKSWRRYMFEESLSLCLCEETCLNALKHKPQLLTRHDREIDSLRTNDAVSLQRLLSKLRVYWPDTLAQHWTDEFFLSLNKSTGQKAIIKGLFALLPQKRIIDFAKKYAPDNFKINWSETDPTKINTRKNIAKHLYVARPPIPLEIVLLYAKGNYLQYTVPSLSAIIAKLSKVESRKHVVKLLEAPVSLRKLGFNLAFSKVNHSELKSFILDIWDTTTNPIIRSVIFKKTYKQLCIVKNAKAEKELWTLLGLIIDKLASRENKEILKYLGKVKNVPLSVRADFFMKSYTYLTSMPVSTRYNRPVNNLLKYVFLTPDIIESFHDNFVTDKLLSPAGTKFCKRDIDFLLINIFGRYVLWGKNEDDQLQRFRMVIEPAMDKAFHSWHEAYIEEYYVKNNFNRFIRYLVENYKDVTLSGRTTPAKLVIEIKIKMEKSLPLLENYVLHTSWKLITEYASLMEQHITEKGDVWSSGEKENIWNEIHAAIFPTLGSRIVNYLKEDTERLLPSIYLLFAEALHIMIESMFYHSEHELELLKHVLIDHDFIPSYIVVSRVTIKHDIVRDSWNRIRTEIRKKIKCHPSQEVQMHYYNDFKDLPLEELAE